MANELQVQVSANLNNGYLKQSFAPGTVSVTQTTLGTHRSVVSVGTSEEDIDDGDVATLGYLFMRNTDTSNYVTYGPKSSGSMVAFGRIKAGEVACMRLEPGITVRAQANTAACKVEFWFVEA